MLRTLKEFLRTCATATLLPAAIYASAVNVDFGSALGPPLSSYGAAADQPGVWNSVTAAGTTNNLVDLSGNATSISVDVTADTFLGALGSNDGGTDALRGDNFFSIDHVWSVVFNDLDNGSYSLYYYSPTNGIVSTGAFTANGVAGANIVGSSSPTLNEGSDWEVITGIDVTNGTLEIDNTANLFDAGLAGVQLVESPEPSSMLLIGAGALLLFVRRRPRGVIEAART